MIKKENTCLFIKNKNAQMKLSFGMIFSIILIVVFLSVAFYAIMKFLDLKDNIQVGDSVNKLESDINRIWKSTQASEKQEYSFPEKIELVCIIDYDKDSKGEFKFYEKDEEVINVYKELERSMSTTGQNLFFYPLGSGGSIGAYELKHIDLNKITQENNPFCIENFRGKVNLILRKDFGKNQIIIDKP